MTLELQAYNDHTNKLLDLNTLQNTSKTWKAVLSKDLQNLSSTINDRNPFTISSSMKLPSSRSRNLSKISELPKSVDKSNKSMLKSNTASSPIKSSTSFKLREKVLNAQSSDVFFSHSLPNKIGSNSFDLENIMANNLRISNTIKDQDTSDTNLRSEFIKFRVKNDEIIKFIKNCQLLCIQGSWSKVKRRNISDIINDCLLVYKNANKYIENDRLKLSAELAMCPEVYDTLLNMIEEHKQEVNLIERNKLLGFDDGVYDPTDDIDDIDHEQDQTLDKRKSNKYLERYPDIDKYAEDDDFDEDDQVYPEDIKIGDEEDDEDEDVDVQYIADNIDDIDFSKMNDEQIYSFVHGSNN